MSLSVSCQRLLTIRRQKLIHFRRTGYIVLLPEVPKDHAEDNALLRSDPLQEFSSLTAEKCYNGLVKRSLDFNSAFWKLEEEIKGKRKRFTVAELFDDYLHPLEELLRSLENTWAVVKLLYSTNENLLSKDNFRRIHQRAQQCRTDMFRSPLLFNCCKEALKKNKENFSDEQNRLLSKFVLEGLLNGMDLSDQKYEILETYLEQIGRRSSFMNTKVEVATSTFTKQISDRNMIKNFPLELLTAISDGKDPKLGPWTVTLQPHVVKKFLEYCPDSLVRHNVWEAYVSRCDNDDEGTRTSVDMEDIRSLRKRQANLLGYKSYADLSMKTKMAGSVDNVYNMLELLLEKARPAQAREIESLNKFALQNGFHKTLDLWDVPYWKRQQQSIAYNFNEDILKVYFPLESVLNGLFSLAKDLFGISVVRRSGVDTWHKDVLFYDVFEDGKDTPAGNIYVDPYKRSGKLNTPDSLGWTINLRNRSTVGSGQSPQVAMIFNFTSPSLGQPSLLTFRNVSDLFGRFGQALQTVLCKTNYAEVSGLSNVEWDAVEMSSNFMVQWLYTPSVMKSISNHFETGEKIPTEILDNLDRVRRHMAGFALCGDIYLSRLDLELYSTDVFWRDIMKKLWPMHFLFPLHKNDSHPCAFTSIFSQDWAAAYFSHLWARVIAADVFSAFEEVGLDNKDSIAVVGKRYQDTFLALSGSCHSSEVFRRFRGRDPSPDALMLWLGLLKHQSSKSSKPVA